MNDSKFTLDTLAQEYKNWRGVRHHVSYPKQFWEDIRHLSKEHSIDEIAKALGRPSKTGGFQTVLRKLYHIQSFSCIDFLH